MTQRDIDKKRLAQLQKLFKSSTEDKLIGTLTEWLHSDTGTYLCSISSAGLLQALLFMQL